MAQPLHSSADRSPFPGRSLPSTAAMITDPDWPLRELFATEPRQACELLFRKYYVALCSHASRFVYSKETAEDIVSEVFYEFYKEQAYANVAVSYKAYLLQAVRYRAYNYVRWELTNERRSTDAETTSVVDHEPSPSEVVQYDELHRRIEQAIDALPPQAKRVFLLSRFEGRKYGEIATELSISIKTVETHMSKALSLLRQAIRNEWMWLLLPLFLLA